MHIYNICATLARLLNEAFEFKTGAVDCLILANDATIYKYIIYEYIIIIRYTKNQVD